ncbi:MAG: 4Fe-4S binding protein [Dethiobacteria bacterium]
MSSHYEQLVERVGFGGSKRLLALLEYLLSPDQAAICAALPASVEEVAEKTGLDVETVRTNLDELFVKGVVFPRGSFVERSYYRFARDIIQLHDATQASQKLDQVKDRRLFQLWEDFCAHEMYPFLAGLSKNLPRAMARVVPAYQAVKDFPDLQPWENFHEILKAQEKIAVVPCSCRSRSSAVGEGCAYTDEPSKWKCLQFGRGADYVIARGSGKPLTLEEALELSDQIEEVGLVHIGGYDRSMFFNTSCQCCHDCCELFVSMNRHDGDLEKLYAKSRYAAYVSTDDCSGCQNCLERCHFDAIDLVRTGKKYKAAVNEEKCWGCGLCVLTCEPGAIRLKAVRPPEYIPEAAG